MTHTRDEVVAIVQQWHDAYNAKDSSRFPATHPNQTGSHPGGRLRDPELVPAGRTIDASTAGASPSSSDPWAEEFRSFPDWQCRLDRLFVDGNVAIVQGMNVADHVEFPQPMDVMIRSPFCYVMEIEDGQITSMDWYYDNALQWLVQGGEDPQSFLARTTGSTPAAQ